MLTEEECSKIIVYLKTKSCAIDTLPTKFLKGCLHSCLESTTKIVNTSLASRTYVEICTSAIVRSLIEKQDLNPINTNHRPITNLSFLW